MRRHTPAVLRFAIALFLATDALAAQRVFVASYGSDGNATALSCSLGAPCRSFATAITQVDPGGEIVALDAAGYGEVTITKSVTITTNPGYFAGISPAPVFNAVTINGAGVNVVLRGLNLNGSQGGNQGIRMTAGASLALENCVVANFAGTGIVIATGASVRIADTVVRGNGWYGGFDGVHIFGGASATLDNVRISGNANVGLAVGDGASVSTIVTVTNSEISHNFRGVIVDNSHIPGTASVIIRSSSISHNVWGVQVLGEFLSIANSMVVGNTFGLSVPGGTLETYGDNVLRFNTTPTEGTITPVSGQ